MKKWKLKRNMQHWKNAAQHADGVNVDTRVELWEARQLLHAANNKTRMLEALVVSMNEQAEKYKEVITDLHEGIEIGESNRQELNDRYVALEKFAKVDEPYRMLLEELREANKAIEELKRPKPLLAICKSVVGLNCERGAVQCPAGECDRDKPVITADTPCTKGPNQYCSGACYLGGVKRPGCGADDLPF